MTSAQDVVRTTRAYVDGPFGQIHLRRFEPCDPARRTAPPLILFHQTPRSSVEYEVLARELARDRLCIAPDTPGFGLSDGPGGPVSMEEYSHALLPVLDALLDTGEAVDVFGFHTGALLALDWAARRPGDIRRVAAVGIPFVTGEERAARYKLRITERQPRAQSGSHLIDTWHALVTTRPQDVGPERAEAVAIDSLSAGDRGWWAYHAVFTYPTEEVLPLVEQPALVIAVDDILARNTRDAAAMLPHATLIELPGASGQFILDTAAGDIARHVRNHQGGVEALAASRSEG